MMDNSEDIEQLGDSLNVPTETQCIDSATMNPQREELDKIIAEFNQKRSRFRELYVVKDKELQTERHRRAELETLVEGLEEKLRRSMAEIEDVKTATGILVAQRDEELERQYNSTQQQLASINSIMQDEIESATLLTAEKYETEMLSLLRIKEEQEAEIKTLRTRADSTRSTTEDSQSIISVIGRAVTGRKMSVKGEDSGLDSSMIQAKADADMLKSIVVPMEREIAKLRTQLEYNEDLVKKLSRTDVDITSFISGKDKSSASSVKNNASKVDLEAVIEILKTQKSVLQEENESLKQRQNDSNETVEMRRVNSPVFGSLLTDSLTHSSSTPEGLNKLSVPRLVPLAASDNSLEKPRRDASSGNRLPALRAAKRRCEMCSNYELQLVSLQHKEAETREWAASLQGQLDQERDAKIYEQNLRSNVEEGVRSAAADAQYQLTAMTDKETRQKLALTLSEFAEWRDTVGEQLRVLEEDRVEAEMELHRLREIQQKQRELRINMDSGILNLPNDIPQLHTLLLSYKEQLFSQEALSGYKEDKLQRELMTCTEKYNRLKEISQSKEAHNLLIISRLEDQLKTHQSTKSALGKETELRIELESQLNNSKSRISELVDKLETESKHCKNLSDEVRQLSSKLHHLQSELASSETVQRDFVKLSQSLQVELEALREDYTTEVRWVNEDDVEECYGCKETFSVTKRRHHCRHCGKVYCSDCLNNTVYSGPHRRPTKVCNICNTLLNKEARPFFS